MVFQCKKNTCKTDAGTFFRLYRRKNPRPETRTGIITCYNTTGKITLPTLIYSCFWRVLRSKLLLQASLHRTLDLFTLVYTIHVNYLAAAAFASLIFSVSIGTILFKSPTLKVSDQLAGRFFNAFGDPIDGGPEIEGQEVEIGGPSVNPVRRKQPRI